MKSNFLNFLIIVYLVISFIGCEENDNDVIDLQELLKDVSATLKSTKDHLKISQICRMEQNIDYPQDCYDLQLSGRKASGVYLVQPLGYEEPFEVYCDMATDGGGWTVFQRRGDFGNPVDYFYKTWKEYKEGFGHLRKEFWLGNDKISALTLQRDYQLRVDLQTMDRKRAHAKYSTFWVENEERQYQLHVSDYSGDAGDSFISWHSEQNFSTKDHGPQSACAESFKGAWWYKACRASNLNGLNLKGNSPVHAEGIVWWSYKGEYYSLYSEMKIKPLTA